MNTLAVAELPTSLPLNLGNRIARRVFTAHLANFRRGEIALHDASGSTCFGERDNLRAEVRVNDPRFFRDAVLGGTLSVAESYLHGDWDCDDLTALFRMFARNSDTTDRLDRSLAKLAALTHRVFHWWHANSRAGSRRNISAHYDLGNEFFRLWLDETMAYSCGIFATPQTTLREASFEKFDRVCRKLDLRPSDQLVEVGGGWGGFAIHAAREFGCRVTTTTISKQQYVLARQKIDDAGMSDRITLLQQDYRDLRGQFDKLVSIEMIEAVGHKNLDAYFRKCGELLRPDGSMVLQAIVMPERGYDDYLRSVDFIQRFVFPGGCLPSLSTILDAVGRSTDLRIVYAEDFASHYAETLRRWRRTFHERLGNVRALGYSEAFVRLWTYYLCYCEAAFEERCVGVLQVQFDKPQCRRESLDTRIQATSAAWEPHRRPETAPCALQSLAQEHRS